ncbi:hypothetical protein ACFU96_48020 [Streptomyces sp. NPDC057620]|uniref:hypothetical protein n=1 Tax=Streptomyces sp. NPDC057620 TaxID=3346185 RepID=UPI0036A2B468
MTGRTYLERGRPVTVIIPFCARRPSTLNYRWLHLEGHGRRPMAGPRNVAIRRADGSAVVRPFRGLRRAPAGEAGPDTAQSPDPPPAASRPGRPTESDTP